MITNAIRKTIFVTYMGKNLLSTQIKNSQPLIRNFDETPTFLLVGGELFNKGAQAMTFTVINDLRNEFPSCDIVLLSSKEFLKERDVNYKFQILPWDEDIKLYLLGYNNGAFRKRSWGAKKVNEVQTVLDQSTAVFDISGYSLSSQLGIETTLSYITDIQIASKHNIPYYILPQSIGPFNYGMPAQILANIMFRKYLPYPSLICPREATGFDALKKYTTENIQLERDIVLQRSNDYDLSNIAVGLDTKIPKIESNAVGIVPNINVVEHSNQNIIGIYINIIEHITENYPVYILKHASDDGYLCDEIYDPFQDIDGIYNLKFDFNAIQLEKIISEFSFIVGSRYHSIVHAYKSGVPAIVISWAEKYRELVNAFEQDEFLYDCRSTINPSEIINTIDRMERNVQLESQKINAMNLSFSQDDGVLHQICDSIHSEII